MVKNENQESRIVCYGDGSQSQCIYEYWDKHSVCRKRRKNQCVYG